MGSDFSKDKVEGHKCMSRRSQALVVYDDKKAKFAKEHVKSDFVDPHSLVNHLRAGDMIQVKGNYIRQWFYSHFAIYVGKGWIVHLDKPENKRSGIKCEVKQEMMVDAFCGRLVRKNNHLDNVYDCRFRSRPSAKIVITALAWVGKDWDYSWCSNNCEHFATLCRYGRPISLQWFGLADLKSGKVSLQEYIACSNYSIEEKTNTFFSWVKRKIMGYFYGVFGVGMAIAGVFDYPALEG